MPKPSTLEEELGEVSKAFLEQLKQKLAQFETAWATVRDFEEIDLEALHALSDIAHELHGQGSFFGYPEVTRYVGQVEEIVDRLIKSSDVFPAEARHKIGGYLERLKGIAFDEATFREPFQNEQDILTKLGDYKRNGKASADPKSILLIDDSDMMRYKISITLRESGFAVIEAADGPTGIALAEKNAPDLILLDIKMPEVNGFEVQRILRSNPAFKDIPLIFITSLSRVSIAQIQEALAYGNTDYIAKPFKMTKLIEKVTGVLRNG
jgi:CheY-like chemotaxis protein